MMATTHVLAGLALVAPIAYAVPELALPLGLGAIVGGLAPDLDLVFTHRRTLHFPVAGAGLVLPVVGVAVLVPGPATAGVAAVVTTGWFHAGSDALGGGPEMDPWNDRSDRAVYDHVRGRWIRPRRWIRYDGAPEDAVLAVALAIPPLLVFEGILQAVVVGAVVVSLGYALLRRQVAELSTRWIE